MVLERLAHLSLWGELFSQNAAEPPIGLAWQAGLSETLPHQPGHASVMTHQITASGFTTAESVAFGLLALYQAFPQVSS